MIILSSLIALYVARKFRSIHNYFKGKPTTACPLRKRPNTKKF
ncbi:hypothetical protein WGH24286_00776 [Periweissella ghanensis]|uniref:Uncharacterized protein n=1 Tax=Periweissella ghanensis TaxID=467997 RepID=A0ABM8ZCF4_9LACO|nr:hypothetical protein WGH24286_00776 [Periweissella ghanensis]